LTADCIDEKYVPSRSLRSSDSNLLSVPRVRTCFGSRSFAVAAPTIWNILLLDIRHSICCFHRHLKTFLYNLVLGRVSPHHTRAFQIQRGFPADIVRNTNLFTYLLTYLEVSVFVCQCVTRQVSEWLPSSVHAAQASPATSTRCATRWRFRTSRRVWIRAQAPATCSPSTSIHRRRSSGESTSTYSPTSDGPSSASSTASTAVRTHAVYTHSLLLLLSSITSVMMRLLCYLMFPSVSVPHQNHCLLYIQLLCFHIFIFIVHPFLRLSSLVSFPYNSVMLLLEAVRFPFLIHARTNLVFALLCCQPVSFLDVEYQAQSHFSSCHVLLLSTIFLTITH